MITEIHKENLRMEQSLRAERVAAGLDLDGYWMLTRAILGDYNCDEESVTRAISNNGFVVCRTRPHERDGCVEKV